MEMMVIGGEMTRTEDNFNLNPLKSQPRNRGVLCEHYLWFPADWLFLQDK